MGLWLAYCCRDLIAVWREATRGGYGRVINLSSVRRVLNLSSLLNPSGCQLVRDLACEALLLCFLSVGLLI